jgi:hypothetical protein
VFAGRVEQPDLARPLPCDQRRVEDIELRRGRHAVLGVGEHTHDTRFTPRYAPPPALAACSRTESSGSTPATTLAGTGAFDHAVFAREARKR